MEPRGLLDFYGNPIYSLSSETTLKTLRKTVFQNEGCSIKFQHEDEKTLQQLSEGGVLILDVEETQTVDLEIIHETVENKEIEEAFAFAERSNFPDSSKSLQGEFCG